jgi:hypothetical protein
MRFKQDGQLICAPIQAYGKMIKMKQQLLTSGIRMMLSRAKADKLVMTD